MKQAPIISQVRIQGFKCLRDVTLDLQGLTVLIGDNGTGKSTILEALELLRMAAHPSEFLSDVLLPRHGRVEDLLHPEADSIVLSVEGRVGDEGAGYTLRIRPNGDLEERYVVFDCAARDESAQTVMEREGPCFRDHGIPARDEASWAEPIYICSDTVNVPPSKLQLPTFLQAAPFIGFGRSWDLAEVLRRMELQPPFVTSAGWWRGQRKEQEGPRTPSMVQSTSRLDRFGTNLAMAFHALRDAGGERWQRVLEMARLGLGPKVRDFRIPPYGRGSVELQVVFGTNPDRPVPAEYLSDGQLAFLCFLALTELWDGRSLLAMDEPELHLHPELVSRVAWMLEETATHAPVLVSTHSDRFLDALSDPAASVVLCELDETGSTRLRRPDREGLAQWLESYRGLGTLRSEGFTEHVFADDDGTSG